MLCTTGGSTESTTSADYYKKGADDANSAIQSRVPDEARQAGEDAAAALKSAVPDEPKQAAKDAVSSVKDALPGKPEEAAKDAASAAKDNIPEPPKDVPNPFSNFFGGKPLTSSGFGHTLRGLPNLRSPHSSRQAYTHYPVQHKPHLCLASCSVSVTELPECIILLTGHVVQPFKRSERRAICIHGSAFIQVAASPRRLHRMLQLR